MKHSIPAFTLAAAFASLLCVSPSASAATYIIDDGVATGGLGIGNGFTGVMLNAFQVGTTADSIIAVQVAFTGTTPVSTPFAIMLFSDPNSDGSPRDGLELARAAAISPASITPGAFVTYSFNAPVALAANQRFFAGVLEVNFNMQIGIDAAGGGTSYAAWDGDNPATASNFGTFASFGFARDYMVRAVGIPEPSVCALFGVFALGGIARRSRR